MFTALEGGIGGTLDAAARLIKVQLTKIRKIVISRPAGLFLGLEIKWSISYIHGFVIAFLSALIDLFSKGFKITKFPMAHFLFEKDGRW